MRLASKRTLQDPRKVLDTRLSGSQVAQWSSQTVFSPFFFFFFFTGHRSSCWKCDRRIQVSQTHAVDNVSDLSEQRALLN